MNKTMTTKSKSTLDSGSSEYSLHPLTREYMQSTADLFIKTFCESEPVTKHLGIQAHEYEPFVMDVIQKVIKDDLGMVAVDKNNKVIACAMGEDIANPFEPTPAHYPKMKPIFALLDKLSEPFLKNKKFVKGKIAHIWVAMVDDAYRGKGLSTVIDLACTDRCARKGYDFTYAEFTNAISEKITRHYSLAKKINSINLSDFTYQSYKPFQDLKGEATAYILGIKPGVTIDALEHCYIENK